MKLLVLFLLFLTGTQGRYFWQNEEPAAEKGAEAYYKIGEDIVNLGSELIDYLESPEKAKEQKIKKTIDALKQDAEDIKNDIEKSFDDAWKETEKELKEKYPVLMKKVVPLLDDFHKRWIKHIFRTKKDASVVVHNLFTGLKKQVDDFMENIQPVLEKGRDKLREEVEALRSKIAVFKDELNEEINRNRKEQEEELKKNYTEFKETVEKELEELRQAIQPYLEKLPDTSSGAEDIKNFFTKLLNEIKDALYADQH